MNRYFKVFLLFVVLFIAPTFIAAQTKDSAVRKKTAREKSADSLARQMDIIDLISKISGAHISSKPDTLQLKPGKLFFAFVPAIG